MPDPTDKKSSRTGEFKSVDVEPVFKPNQDRPSSLPEFTDSPGSTTGVMRIYREGDDDTAKGEDNNPVEPV